MESESKIKAFESGLSALKEEIDNKETIIVELNKEMDFHKPSVTKFHELKDKKKISSGKREKSKGY